MRDFIHGSLLEFERSKFEKVTDMTPTAFFYDENGQLVHQVVIEEFKRYKCYVFSMLHYFALYILFRKELYDLFESWGIQKKDWRKQEL